MCEATFLLPDGPRRCQTHPRRSTPNELVDGTPRMVVHRIFLEESLGLGMTVIDWTDGSAYADREAA